MKAMIPNQRGGTRACCQEIAQFGNRDGDLAACVALLDIADGGGCFAEGVGPVENRGDFACAHEICEEGEIGGIHVCEEPRDLLAYEWSSHNALEHSSKEVNGSPVGASATASDVCTFGAEHTQGCR